MKDLGPRLVVACALVAFGATQWWMSERIGSWSEEVSTYPSLAHATLVAGEDGAVELDSCAGATRLRASSTRPIVALCAGGRTWPVLGTSYFSTWPYWPLGAAMPYDVFALRKLSLLFGVLTLLLAYTVARRLADARVAAAGVAAAALSSPFVVPHSVLIHFEILQLPLVVLAAWTAARARDGALTRSRAVAVGALAGLAVAVDVKGAFLLGPLALLAWRTRVWPSPRPGAVAALAAAALLPLVPMLALDLAAPQAGASGQLAIRAHNVVARIASGSALLEPLNCVRFWTDLASYGEQASGRRIGTPGITYLVPAASLVYVTIHFVRAIASRSHDALAAALGALIASYVVLAALLWNQTPAANYAPLHVAFGLASGTTALGVARWTQARFGLSLRATHVLAASLVALCVAGFAWDTFRTGDPSRQASATNAVAQREVARWLRAHPGGTAATATYDVAGVIDAVSGGRVRTVDVRGVLEVCGTDDVDPACVAGRLAEAAHRLGRLRLVLPATTQPNTEPAAAALAPAMRILATRDDVTVVHETSVRGVGTPPLLEVWDVRPRGAR